MFFRNKLEIKKLIEIPNLSKKYLLNTINNNNSSKYNSQFLNFQNFKFTEKSNPINSNTFDKNSLKLNLDGKDFLNFNDFYEKMKINIESIHNFNSKLSSENIK